MSRNIENSGFICLNCKRTVVPISNGSYRNHCPFCLYSLHVDDEMPGDRLSQCRELMEPIGIRYHSKKGYQILHRCTQCRKLQYNIISNSPSQPDNKVLIYKLMRLPFHETIQPDTNRNKGKSRR